MVYWLIEVGLIVTALVAWMLLSWSPESELPMAVAADGSAVKPRKPFRPWRLIQVVAGMLAVWCWFARHDVIVVVQNGEDAKAEYYKQFGTLELKRDGALIINRSPYVVWFDSYGGLRGTKVIEAGTTYDSGHCDVNWVGPSDKPPDTIKMRRFDCQGWLRW